MKSQSFARNYPFWAAWHLVCRDHERRMTSAGASPHRQAYHRVGEPGVRFGGSGPRDQCRTALPLEAHPVLSRLSYRLPRLVRTESGVQILPTVIDSQKPDVRSILQLFPLVDETMNRVFFGIRVAFGRRGAPSLQGMGRPFPGSVKRRGVWISVVLLE